MGSLETALGMGGVFVRRAAGWGMERWVWGICKESGRLEDRALGMDRVFVRRAAG